MFSFFSTCVYVSMRARVRGQSWDWKTLKKTCYQGLCKEKTLCIVKNNGPLRYTAQR